MRTATSTHRVNLHRRRKRARRAVFHVELSVPELLDGLELAGHLEGPTDTTTTSCAKPFSYGWMTCLLDGASRAAPAIR
jgi:hypothetical protein